MNIREKRNQAYQVIQASPVLYKQWNECLTQREREEMISVELWNIAFQEGYAKCDEDVSMGG